MRSLKWIALMALCIVLGGCPYTSEAPIDSTPSVKINEALIGTWEPKNSSEDRYIITKVDDYNYRIQKKSGNSKDSTVYRAYLSNIDGDNFLNLWEENGTVSKAYYFYKLELSPSGTKLTLSSVTENITEKFTSSEDLKAFFKKYKTLSFFFGKDAEVFIKD